MKKLTIICSLIFIFSLVSSVAAQNLKIGVIDTDKLFLNSAMGKKAFDELKQYQEKLQQQLTTMREDVQGLEKRINDGRQSLSGEQIAQLNKELEDKKNAYKKFYDGSSGDIAQRREKMLAEFDRKIMPVINKVADEMGYTLIFRKFESGLIFANDAVDITNLVIQRLDAIK